MRHIRSIFYALVLAPAAWVLTGVGLTSDLTARGRDGFAVENFLGLLLLLLAGAAYGILVLGPISPAGPVAAGAFYLAITVWALLAPSAYADAWPPAVSKEGFDLSRPGFGLAALLAVPLLSTALSARRWQKYEPPVLPLIGDLGRFWGRAAAPTTPLAAVQTTVIPTAAALSASAPSAAASDSTTALLLPAIGRPAADELSTDLASLPESEPTPLENVENSAQAAPAPGQEPDPADGELTTVLGSADTPAPAGNPLAAPELADESTTLLTPTGESTTLLGPAAESASGSESDGKSADESAEGESTTLLAPYGESTTLLGPAAELAPVSESGGELADESAEGESTTLLTPADELATDAASEPTTVLEPAATGAEGEPVAALAPVDDDVTAALGELEAAPQAVVEPTASAELTGKDDMEAVDDESAAATAEVADGGEASAAPADVMEREAAEETASQALAEAAVDARTAGGQIAAEDGGQLVEVAEAGEGTDESTPAEAGIEKPAEAVSASPADEEPTTTVEPDGDGPAAMTAAARDAGESDESREGDEATVAARLVAAEDDAASEAAEVETAEAETAEDDAESAGVEAPRGEVGVGTGEVGEWTRAIKLADADDAERTQVVHRAVGDDGESTQVVRLPVEDDSERTQVVRLPLGESAEDTQAVPRKLLPFPVSDPGERTQVINPQPDNAEQTQVLRFPARPIGEWPTRDVRGIGSRTRDLSDRMTGDVGGDETQVIRFAGKTVDDERTQIIRPHLGSIADVEAPDFAEDPTGRIVPLSALLADAEEARPKTVLDMERPADEKSGPIPRQRKPGAGE
ncbi:hypothetical protein GCM10010172_12260 [Paractinoplanes ferrugineus]|uniref:Uncharacterized protein n=1 Tax=Paractinoplanes ferrugineus TaxID=113564 RepID=A0A919IVH0_9ACTN|nr:hypothetical protein [Actinoplanes ferrugineus]GIE09791.1 hypothetical protein Afe05nite_16310 [Actinoplanes ferrugineus]